MVLPYARWLPSWATYMRNFKEFNYFLSRRTYFNHEGIIPTTLKHACNEYILPPNMSYETCWGVGKLCWGSCITFRGHGVYSKSPPLKWCPSRPLPEMDIRVVSYTRRVTLVNAIFMHMGVKVRLNTSHTCIISLINFVALVITSVLMKYVTDTSGSIRLFLIFLQFGDHIVYSSPDHYLWLVTTPPRHNINIHHKLRGNASTWPTGGSLPPV